MRSAPPKSVFGNGQLLCRILESTLRRAKRAVVDLWACPLLADTVAKVFLGDERKFLEPLMRFIRGDVRDHIVSSKIDHGPP
jgi:hypothetical protein